MIRGALALARVIPNIKIRVYAVRPAIVAQYVVACAQHLHRLVVDDRVRLAPAPLADLCGKAVQLFPTHMRFTQISPGVHHHAHRNDGHEQDRKTNRRRLHQSTPSAGTTALGLETLACSGELISSTTSTGFSDMVDGLNRSRIQPTANKSRKATI